MKRFPTQTNKKGKMHIQLIPYDSFCFVRARESPVLPRLSIYLYFIPTTPPAFLIPFRGLSNLINMHLKLFPFL